MPLPAYRLTLTLCGPLLPPYYAQPTTCRMQPHHSQPAALRSISIPCRPQSPPCLRGSSHHTLAHERALRPPKHESCRFFPYECSKRSEMADRYALHLGGRMASSLPPHLHALSVLGSRSLPFWACAAVPLASSFLHRRSRNSRLSQRNSHGSRPHSRPLLRATRRLSPALVRAFGQKVQTCPLGRCAFGDGSSPVVPEAFSRGFPCKCR